MTVQATIEQKLTASLAPAHLEVTNESHMHSVPAGSESHFKIIVVTDAFDDQRLIQRHQAVNAVLADELAGPLHALSMETLTPAEWQARGGATFASPDCMGGSKADQ